MTSTPSPRPTMTTQEVANSLPGAVKAGFAAMSLGLALSIVLVISTNMSAHQSASAYADFQGSLTKLEYAELYHSDADAQLRVALANASLQNLGAETIIANVGSFVSEEARQAIEEERLRFEQLYTGIASDMLIDFGSGARSGPAHAVVDADIPAVTSTSPPEASRDAAAAVRALTMEHREAIAHIESLLQEIQAGTDALVDAFNGSVISLPS